MRLASPGMVGQGRGNGRRPPAQPKIRPIQIRSWKNLNITDDRTGIDDDELAWLENAILVGKGAIQALPGPGASIATLAQGIVTMHGFTLNGSPVFVVVGGDGSLTQVTPGGVATVIAGAGTVTAPDCTMWQGTRILIIDPTMGYMSWDGTTFSVISSGVVGTRLVVFEGHVWIFNGRNIQHTAPNTYSDFTAGNGAGVTVLTDEAFPGNIVGAISGLEQLWIAGQGAIDTLSNVTASGTAPNVVTTFSITNVISGLGTNAPASLIIYLRAMAFAPPFAIYALSGVTPQKLSDKLDRLFPSLTLAPDVPAAIGVVESLICLFFLVTYTGSNAKAGAPPQKLLLGFTNGKWFFGAQGVVVWITTVIVNGEQQVWATNGTTIFRPFAAAATENVAGKIQTKLFDFGLATTMHQALKVGMELSAPNPATISLGVDSEVATEVQSISDAGGLILTGAGGAVINLTGAGGAALTLTTQALALIRKNSNMWGRYLGFTLTWNCPPFRLQALQMEVADSREWDR